MLLERIEHLLLENLEAAVGKQRQVAYLKEITIEIVKRTVDTLRENYEILPDCDERIKKILTPTIL